MRRLSIRVKWHRIHPRSFVNGWMHSVTNVQMGRDKWKQLNY